MKLYITSVRLDIWSDVRFQNFFDFGDWLGAWNRKSGKEQEERGYRCPIIQPTFGIFANAFIYSRQATRSYTCADNGRIGGHTFLNDGLDTVT